MLTLCQIWMKLPMIPATVSFCIRLDLLMRQLEDKKKSILIIENVWEKPLQDQKGTDGGMSQRENTKLSSQQSNMITFRLNHLPSKSDKTVALYAAFPISISFNSFSFLSLLSFSSPNCDSCSCSGFFSSLPQAHSLEAQLSYPPNPLLLHLTKS